MVAATKHPWPRRRKPVQLQSVKRLWLSAVGMLLMSQNDIKISDVYIGQHVDVTVQHSHRASCTENTSGARCQRSILSHTNNLLSLWPSNHDTAFSFALSVAKKAKKATASCKACACMHSCRCRNSILLAPCLTKERHRTVRLPRPSEHPPPHHEALSCMATYAHNEG